MFIQSFGDYCKENNLLDLLDLWDYDLNPQNPYEVGSHSPKKYYFKCPKGKHASHFLILANISKTKKIICPGCNSIGQYLIDKYGKEDFERMWDDSNDEDPFLLAKNSGKIIKINCLKDSTHPIRITHPSSVSKDLGCPYCANQKVCLTNSLGYLFPESLKVWSENNDITPYDITPGVLKRVELKCENGIHPNYMRTVSEATKNGFKCSECLRDNNRPYNFEDLTGKRFGLWTVTGYDREKSKEIKSTYWLADCDCGKKNISVCGAHLKSGVSKSCGCRWYYATAGENNWNWKGGTKNENAKERGSGVQRRWRNSIREMCEYTCQCCGISYERMEAHHILNYSSNKELRNKLDNGICFCHSCHKEFHKIYTKKNNNEFQLTEFINNKRKSLGINIPFTIESYLNGAILKPIKEEFYYGT